MYGCIYVPGSRVPGHSLSLPGVASKISVRLGLLAGRAGWQRWLAGLDALDGGHELLAGLHWTSFRTLLPLDSSQDRRSDPIHSHNHREEGGTHIQGERDLQPWNIYRAPTYIALRMEPLNIWPYIPYI